jgi:hypothetical protein
MGDIDRHLRIAQEKLAATEEAYRNQQHTVVGDLAIKVVEQLIEADAASHNMHFGAHQERQAYTNREYPHQITVAMRKIWFAYGDLGYDGTNGHRARLVMRHLKTVAQFLEKRLGKQIWNSADSRAGS